MKPLNMILLFAAVLFSIAIFDFHPVDQQGSFNIAPNYSNYSAAYNYSSYQIVNGTTIDSNSIWEVFMHPYRGGATVMFGFVIFVAIYLAIIGLFNIIGFGYRSDLSMMGIFFIFMIGIGLIPTAIIYNFFYRETAAYACTAAMTHCWFGEMIGGLIAGSLLVMWFFACLEWWTQRQT